MTKGRTRRFVPERSGYFRPFRQGQGIAVAGTWAWSANALQTDFASVTGEAAGSFANVVGVADLDEYKWSSVFLAKGTYKATVTHITSSNRGIAQVLFGTSVLATKDCYSAGAVYNVKWEITFVLTADTTADLRFRVNGKNAASTNYYVEFSRLEVEKVA